MPGSVARVERTRNPGTGPLPNPSTRAHRRMHEHPPRWQFWIDRGGTFTDIVARRPDGTLVTHKLLSENPRALPRRGGRRHPPAARPRSRARRSRRQRVECVKMGTTVATNALLERKGEPTLLVTTRGFRDALRIAYQNRPRLFDRRIVLPELLYSRGDRGAGARRRARRGGRGARRRSTCARRCRRPARAASRSVAIVFMHGYRYHAHELAAERLARAGRLHAGQRQPQGEPDDEVRQPRRHHGGRRLPVADPAPLRRAGGGRDARRASCSSCSRRAGWPTPTRSRARTRS